MYPLFESVCVKNGEIQHAYWHQKRFEFALGTYFENSKHSSLFKDITIPDKYRTGLVKMKVLFNAYDKQVSFEDYNIKSINTLQLVEDNNIDYQLKFCNRDHLKSLYLKKELCDDILIIKNGKLTDTSYCNIVFYDDHSWWTPKSPLLKGTGRQRLLLNRIIYEREITVKDLEQYSSFKLINALRDFNEVPATPVSNIYK